MVGLGLKKAMLVAVPALVMGTYVVHMPTQADSFTAVDSSEPIEITSDALEIEQKRGLAIFTGSVVASQGNLILRAEVVTVYYGDHLDNQTGEPLQGQISKIEASGDVFFSTLEETARSEKGIYNVEGEKITLSGGVVLTRRDNVLRGELLELDLKTGRSRLYGGQKKSDRVKALFSSDESE